MGRRWSSCRANSETNASNLNMRKGIARIFVGQMLFTASICVSMLGSCVQVAGGPEAKPFLLLVPICSGATVLWFGLYATNDNRKGFGLRTRFIATTAAAIAMTIVVLLLLRGVGR
jgi:hypothetical protein